MEVHEMGGTIRVDTISGNTAHKYVFEKHGDTLYLKERYKGDAAPHPGWKSAKRTVTSAVRSELKSRGYDTVSTSPPPGGGMLGL